MMVLVFLNLDLDDNIDTQFSDIVKKLVRHTSNIDNHVNLEEWNNWLRAHPQAMKGADQTSTRAFEQTDSVYGYDELMRRGEQLIDGEEYTQQRAIVSDEERSMFGSRISKFSPGIQKCIVGFDKWIKSDAKGERRVYLKTDETGKG